MDAEMEEVQNAEEKIPVVANRTGRPNSTVWDWFTNVVVQEVHDGNPLAKSVKRSQCLHCSTRISSRAFRLKAHLLKCKASADAGVPVNSFDVTPRAPHSKNVGKVLANRTNIQKHFKKLLVENCTRLDRCCTAVGVNNSLPNKLINRPPVICTFVFKLGADASTTSLRYYDEQLQRALGAVQGSADAADDRPNNVGETDDDNSDDYSPSRQVRARGRSDCDPIELAILAHLEKARKTEPKDNVQLFLESLSEPMRRLTPKQFALARIKIDSIMYEITYESNEPLVV